VKDPGPEPTLPALADTPAREEDRLRRMVDEAFERVLALVEREATDPAMKSGERYQSRRVLFEAAAALRRCEAPQLKLQARPRARATRPEPVYERIDLPRRSLPS
jgi:hypothetical protein